jgi:hypothetical protein
MLVVLAVDCAKCDSVKAESATHAHVEADHAVLQLSPGPLEPGCAVLEEQRIPALVSFDPRFTRLDAPPSLIPRYL